MTDDVRTLVFIQWKFLFLRLWEVARRMSGKQTLPRVAQGLLCHVEPAVFFQGKEGRGYSVQISDLYHIFTKKKPTVEIIIAFPFRTAPF